MEFKDYIEALGLLELNIIVRDNSDITIPSALDIVRDRVNRSANSFPDVDVKAKISDFRDGNIYEVFSDRWLDKYDQKSWWNLQLNNVAIQKMLNTRLLQGYSEDVIIDSKEGVLNISVDNPDKKKFNVFTKIEDKEGVRLDLVDETVSGFSLVIKDLTTFEENNKDCSEDKIKVNYLIIYEG